jgi:hypothetical protein
MAARRVERSDSNGGTSATPPSHAGAFLRFTNDAARQNHMRPLLRAALTRRCRARLLRFAHPCGAAFGWLSHFVRLSLATALQDRPLAKELGFFVSRDGTLAKVVSGFSRRTAAKRSRERFAERRADGAWMRTLFVTPRRLKWWTTLRKRSARRFFALAKVVSGFSRSNRREEETGDALQKGAMGELPKRALFAASLLYGTRSLARRNVLGAVMGEVARRVMRSLPPGRVVRAVIS